MTPDELDAIEARGRGVQPQGFRSECLDLVAALREAWATKAQDDADMIQNANGWAAISAEWKRVNAELTEKVALRDAENDRLRAAVAKCGREHGALEAELVYRNAVQDGTAQAAMQLGAKVRSDRERIGMARLSLWMGLASGEETIKSVEDDGDCAATVAVGLKSACLSALSALGAGPTPDPSASEEVEAWRAKQAAHFRETIK